MSQEQMPAQGASEVEAAAAAEAPLSLSGPDAEAAEPGAMMTSMKLK